jgi:hypothetical protein
LEGGPGRENAQKLVAKLQDQDALYAQVNYPNARND